MFNIKASPHTAVSRRPAATIPRALSPEPLALKAGWGGTTFRSFGLPDGILDGIPRTFANDPDMETAVFLSRDIVAMNPPGHGKAQLPNMVFGPRRVGVGAGTR